MKLIIGLGNPGKQYENTRHNIGFLMIDTLFDAWREEKKYKSLLSQSCLLESLSGVTAIKPQTFMNLSGEAVSALVSFYQLDPRQDILVISDDIDMVWGKVRYRVQGSHGGQNGLRDIIDRLSTDEFARIKIGVGRDDRYSVSDWVLSGLSNDERSEIAGAIREQVITYIHTWLGD